MDLGCRRVGVVDSGTASPRPSRTFTSGCYPVTLYAKWAKNSYWLLAAGF